SNTKSRQPVTASTVKSAPVFTSFAAVNGGGAGSLAMLQRAVPFPVTAITARDSAGASAASVRSNAMVDPDASTATFVTVAPGPVTTALPPSSFEPVTVSGVVVAGPTRRGVTS